MNNTDIAAHMELVREYGDTRHRAGAGESDGLTDVDLAAVEASARRLAAPERTEQAARCQKCGLGPPPEGYGCAWCGITPQQPTLSAGRKLDPHGFMDTGVMLRGEQAAPDWKDHDTAKLVNELRDIAVTYAGAQQLRERIAYAVRPLTDRLQQAAPEGWRELLTDLTRHASECDDHTPKSFSSGVLGLAIRAHKLLTAATSAPTEPVVDEREAAPQAGPKSIPAPVCYVCGTTEGLTKYPRHYSCNGPSCIAF